MQILFVMNKQFLGRWIRYFKREYPLMDVDTIDFETLSVSDKQFLDEYSLVIVCIEKYVDLLKYKLCKGNKNIVHQIHLLDINKKTLRRMVFCNKFLYEPGRLKGSIDGLLNIIRSDSVVPLNCNDLLRLANESELLCQGVEGIKEVVLFDAVIKWKMSKSLRSCLVNIVGDITLTDVSEMACDNTIILFMREKGKEQESFITIEVEDGVIKQALRAYNHGPNEKQKRFLREYAKLKNLVLKEDDCFGWEDYDDEY